MSKENEKETSIKYCVHCGAEVERDQTYCPKCGKLVIKLTSTKQQTLLHTNKIQQVSPGKKEMIRKCAGCGSLITSSVLEQCPICNTVLDKIPEKEKPIPQIRPGFIFTEKKLEPAEKFLLKKDTWSLREGLNVFGNSILFYITTRLIIFMLFSFLRPEESGLMTVDMTSILLSQIPEMIFGLYPIWYIYSKNHNFKKLGFFSDSKKIIIAFALGILGCVGLYFINFFSDSIITFLYRSGIRLIDIQVYIAEEHQILRNSELVWIILLIILLSIASLSLEILFRGVLHNTLKEKYGKDVTGRITVVLLVALVYSIVYLFFSFPIGIYFLIFNFLFFLLLGILYEINGNLLNSIIASVLYNIIIVVLIIAL